MANSKFYLKDKKSENETLILMHSDAKIYIKRECSNRSEIFTFSSISWI